MRCAYGIAWVVTVAIGSSAAAQGLGEAAAREKRRREAQTQAEAKEKAKTFTDEDLQKYTRETPGGASAASPPAEDGGTTTAAKPSVPAAGTKGPGEEFKRTRAAMIKADLQQCQASLAAARAAYKEAETNEPSVDYPAGYPVSEAEARDRVREIKTANLRAAKARVDGLEKSCVAIEDSARRESIPPGWIR